MAFLRDKSIFCIPNTTLNNDQRHIISTICIPTSTLGFIGAALQLRHLWQYRSRQPRKQSADPRIIFYLALSDLITCFGLFTLGILLLVFEPPYKVGDDFKARHNDLYSAVGTSVEIVALLGFLASVIWTFSFALDMFFQMYKIYCPIVVYHILSWCIPINFVVVIQAVNFGIWPVLCEGFNGRRSRLILSYLPVITVIILNPVLFLVTYRKVMQLLRSSGIFTDEERQALNRFKWKLFWMVATFTICWLPNVISVLYDLVKYAPEQVEMSKLDCLWYLEAFLNPLQGILNYFVYRHSFKVSSNPEVRRRGLPRAPPNDSVLEDCLADEEKRPLKNKKQNPGYSTSPGENDTKDFLLNSGKTLNARKEPKDKYVARLLGEKHH